MPPSSRQLERLNCVFLNEKFRKSSTDWMIGRGRILPTGDASTIEQAKADTTVDFGGLQEGDCIDLTGVCPKDSLEEGLSYAFWGKYEEYRGKTKFAFSKYEPIQPMDEDSIIDYLARAGRGNGVGRGRARQIFERYGSSSIRMVRENPHEVCREVRGLEIHRIQGMVDWLKERQVYEQTLVTLNRLLGGRGFPRDLPLKLVEKYGNLAADKVSKDPFVLMAESRCGVGLCDRLWVELGKKQKSLKRQAYIIAAALDDSARSTGSTWIRINDAKYFAEKRLKSQLRFTKAVKFGLRAGLLAAKKTVGIDGPICDKIGDIIWLAYAKHARQETVLADRILEAIRESDPIQQVRREQVRETVEVRVKSTRCRKCNRELTADEVWVFEGHPYGPTCIGYVDPSHDASEKMSLDQWTKGAIERREITRIKEVGVETVDLKCYWPAIGRIPDISDHQREALRKAFFLPNGKPSRVAILGGSPGTGKTRTVANVIKAIQESGTGRIIAGAPTGKAAVKLTTTLHGYGVQHVKAKTWHSIFGQTRQQGSSDWSFAANRENRLQTPILIGDEESMLGLFLQYSKWQARGQNCHMLLVGDINQLAPVEPGATLRDFIGAGLPYGELREIWRNDGGIVEACRAIRDGEQWEPSGNLTIGGETTPEAQIASIRRIIHKAKQDGLDPIWDVQPLVIVNEHSQVSRVELNKLLQADLNPNVPEGKCPFAVGDKLVNLENGWFKVLECEDGVDKNEDGETRIANGEQGELIEIDDKYYVVELKEPYRKVKVWRGKQQDDEQSDIYASDENAASRAKNRTGCSWDLGYALSVWKSQGSDWPIVIPVIDTYGGAKRLASRELIYTAISRGKLFCHMVGQLAVARRYCERAELPLRKTFLREEILRKWLDYLAI